MSENDQPRVAADSIFSKVINSMKTVFNNASLLKGNKRRRFKRTRLKYPLDVKKPMSARECSASEVSEGPAVALEGVVISTDGTPTTERINAIEEVSEVTASDSDLLKEVPTQFNSEVKTEVNICIKEQVKPAVSQGENDADIGQENIAEASLERSSSNDVEIDPLTKLNNAPKLPKRKKVKKVKHKHRTVDRKDRHIGVDTCNTSEPNTSLVTCDIVKDENEMVPNKDDLKAVDELSDDKITEETLHKSFIKVENAVTVSAETSPKPRIVLKIRSEKIGLKRSNVKIVCETDKVSNIIDKKEELVKNSKIVKKRFNMEKTPVDTSMRRSKLVKRRLAGKKDVQLKVKCIEDLQIAPMESHSADGLSLAKIKRSTRRLSKEYSENILANAIARKQKLFNEGSMLTKRRIKPTAKILANEELRIGLETQNNVRMGISPEKSNEETYAVQLRRSSRFIPERRSAERNFTKAVHDKGNNKMKKKVTRNRKYLSSNNDKPAGKDLSAEEINNCILGPVFSESETKPTSKSLHKTSEEIEIQRLNKLKKKHMSKLGLKAVDSGARSSAFNEHLTDDSTMDSTATEAIIEYLNAQKRSLDYERELLERVSINESSEDDPEDLPARPLWSKRSVVCDDEEDANEYASVNHDRHSRLRLRSEVKTLGSNANPVVIRNCDSPATAEVPEDKALAPKEGARTIVGCLCDERSTLYVAPKMLEDPVYCKAVDQIDALRVGCCHLASKDQDPASPDYSPLVRPSVRAPYFLACDLHRARLAMHQCCPGCGLFCTQGVFYECSRGHFFHIECALPHPLNLCMEADDTIYGGDLPLGCPHCGVDRSIGQNVNTEMWSVRIDMDCFERTILVPYQRTDVSPSYMTFRPPKCDQSVLKSRLAQPRRNNNSEDHPIIPAKLLPSVPIDLDALRIGKMEMIDYDDVLIGVSNVESPQEDLFNAIVNNCDHANIADKVLAALALHANPHKKLISVENGTYLHLAAREFNLSAVHILKCADCDVNALDNQSRTPLMVAILNFDGELCMGADRSRQNADAEAVSAAKMAVIKYLVKAGSNILQKGPDGLTALHLAAKCGNVAVCEILLDSLQLSSLTSYLNSQDEGGWTPLVWAAENKHTDVVKFLLSRGADLSVSDTERNTALHWAALAGCASTLDALLSAAVCTPLDVDSANVQGDTPLHVCARQDFYSCVVVLLAKGARVDMKNTTAETPLDASPDENSESHRAMVLNSQLAVLTDGRMWNKPKILSNDISQGREPFPISCINEVDNADLPTDFFYISENCHQGSIHIDTKISSMQGCNCRSGNCSDESCSCVDLSMKCWYDGEGRLLKDFDFAASPMVFECNGTCGCNRLTCQNTVVGRRRGSSVFTRVQVYRLGHRRKSTVNSSFPRAETAMMENSILSTSPLPYWGLRAMTPIPYGSPVAVYCGEIVTTAEADERVSDEYVFSLDMKHGLIDEDKTTYCIDATMRGGVARFINHSCAANLAPVKVFSWHRDLRLPDAVFFATRDITAGEELTFDYGPKFWSVKSKLFSCLCDSDDCLYPCRDGS